MAIEFDGKGNIVGTTQDGVIAVKLYSLEKQIKNLKSQLQQKENIIKEVRELVDDFDVFKEFTFPLMKSWEEQEVKSSIDYEWEESIKNQF